MTKDELFDAFKIAIEKEYEAHGFYRDLAQKTTDGEIKKLLERFAGDELYHLEKLKDLYREMKEGAVEL